MCKNPVQNAKPKLLLTSVEDFYGKQHPDPKALLVTIVFYLGLLFTSEMGCRIIIASMKNFHPILEDETNRQILARHIGVDSVSCFTVAYLGFKARYIMQEMVDAVIYRKNSMPVAYENRLFKYHPESAQICLFFMAYNIKNTVDTFIWNDGILFVMHHILTLGTTWGGLIPGSAQFYIPFYFGMSEVSTAVLCLLANFDDEFGVQGLADAFPLGKAVLGGLFAVLFIICRVFMWSTVSYYYCRDAWNALHGNDPRLQGRKTFLKFTFVSLGLLSVLQVIWLGEIFRIGYEELTKMGYI